ncbi:MAG TPA: FAD binding domain-containing protein [Bacteroidota bacterium]|nr:FAD binding domain-containing protein [Bacteroidota bacterium]
MNIQFECIINNTPVAASVNPGTVVLDFLRKHEHLTGTKEGCREGDCGACTILVGALQENHVVYKSVNSCLMPLGDAQGKHIVTIEGVNLPAGELNPIQRAFVDEGGTQCGFCTPGFILSLTGYCLNAPQITMRDAVTAVDGNICRCTGHPPIKKAIHQIIAQLEKRPPQNGMSIKHLIEQKLLPEYFLTIASRLKEIEIRRVPDIAVKGTPASFVSGGTDLYVQKAFSMHVEETQRISAWQHQANIAEDEHAIYIPGTTTVEIFRLSPIIEKYFPQLKTQLELFGSTPIRNRATIAGNLVNASPIGDMTCLLIALDATLTLRDATAARTLPLRKFYTGYKQLDKKKSELVETISFPRPHPSMKWSYEKISRRQYLDIASVNSTMVFDLNHDVMSNVAISAGGVGPIAMFLSKSSALLNGKSPTPELIEELFEVAQIEIQPISDARGTADYKRLLLRQLLAVHILKFFPDVVRKEMLV